MTVDPTVVITAIGALATGIGWIVRRVYLDLVTERNYWRTIALASIRHTDKAMDIAVAKTAPDADA